MVESNRSALPRCSQAPSRRDSLMTKTQQHHQGQQQQQQQQSLQGHQSHQGHQHQQSRTVAGAVSGTLTAPTNALHGRRRRHKTVHFGENLLMQVCANRQHLAGLGPRLPDVSFCHEPRGGRTPGARYCCLAHHCCLAQTSLPQLPSQSTVVTPTSNHHHSRRHQRLSRSDSHSSGTDSTLDRDKASKKQSKTVPKKSPTGEKTHHHHIHTCPLHPSSLPKSAQVAKKSTTSPYLCFPSKLEPNVQQLFSFIESVLSAWAAEEGLTSTGEYSEPDERDVNRRKIKKYKLRTNILNIRRIVYDVSILRGSKLLGNVRYRHIHWKGTAQACNEMFLRKVRDILNGYPKTRSYR